MAKRKKKRGNPALLWLGLLGLAVLGVLTYYAANQPNPQSRPAEGSGAPIQKHVAPKPPAQAVTVLVPEFVNGELRFKEIREQVAPGQPPEVFAVNAFLKETGFVPPKARAVSVTVDRGLATVTFTPEFEATYGTEDEQTLVNGILKALGQFKNIQKVSMRVGGHPLDTLGSIDLSEPQDVIR